MNAREVKIYCPKCHWEPLQASRWICSCGRRWNTFDTGGICPACSEVWEETQCLACQRWSRHGEWYHEFIGGLEMVTIQQDEPHTPESGH